MSRSGAWLRGAGRRLAVLTRRAVALALAAQLGCYHTYSYQVRKDTVERVERVSMGTRVSLAALEVEPGRIAVAAQERAMCRDEEQGTRTFATRTVSSKRPVSGGGGDAVGLLAGSRSPLEAAGVAAVFLVLLIPFTVVYLALPDSSQEDVPTGEPKRPYRQWDDQPKPCGDRVWAVPGLRVRMLQRQDESSCQEWFATTTADGVLALPPELDRSAAVTVRCDPPLGKGLLRLEPVPDPDASPDPAEPDRPHRTYEALELPLKPEAVQGAAPAVAGG